MNNIERCKNCNDVCKLENGGNIIINLYNTGELDKTQAKKELSYHLQKSNKNECPRFKINDINTKVLLVVDPKRARGNIHVLPRDPESNTIIALKKLTR